MRLESRPLVAGTLRSDLVYLAIVLAVLSCAQPAAADWAQKMFATTSHDFGTIAAGAKAEYAFRFKNQVVPDVHVASVRSSCGCASVRVERTR